MTPLTPTPPPTLPPVPPALSAALRDLLHTFEGVIPHMYLDTAGNVTVGCGHLLTDEVRASLLPFVNRFAFAGNTPHSLHAASTTEIETEFNVIKVLRAGMNANYYASFTTLILFSAAIDQLLAQDVALVQLELEYEFPGWPDFPPDAQTALTDMGFNLGVHGLVNKFPHFCNAVKAQDWRLAATHCTRIGISNARNTIVQNLLISAGRAPLPLPPG